MQRPGVENSGRYAGSVWAELWLWPPFVCGLVAMASLLRWLLVAWFDLTAPQPALWWALGLVAVLPGVALLVQRPHGDRTALAVVAGLGVGVGVGLAASLASPAYWFSPDTAWHTAKVAAVAAGSPLLDPIYQWPSMYPFAWHLLPAALVEWGLPLRAVMTALPALSLAATGAAFWLLARSCMEDRAAAAVSLALPLTFHAPLRGYILLPEPFNGSLPLVFVALALLVRGRARHSHLQIGIAGLLLGAAGLFWYGHLPWIALFVAAVAVYDRGALRPLVLGGLSAALVLLWHLASLPEGALGGGGGVLGAVAGVQIGERSLGILTNLFTLSGSADVSAAPWWIGALLAAVFVSTAVGWNGVPRSHFLLVALVSSLALVLVSAGLLMRYWEPFSWRYAMLLWSLLLLLGAWRADLQLGSWRLPVAAPVALLALPYLCWTLLPVVRSSMDLSQQYDRTGADLVAFLDGHSAPLDPVFASIATWEHGIGCCTPRPNLSDRDGGTYKYAPAAIAGPRFETYLEVAALEDPHKVNELLAPYGFRLAVIHRKDLARPGYLALTRGFPVLFKNADFVVVELTP